MCKPYKFKIGDKVTLIESRIQEVAGGETPRWFNNDTYTITEIVDELDSYNYPIVRVRELRYKITTYYLSLSLREKRKRKLEKLKSL